MHESPGSEYPLDDFEKAWVNTLLYSEHTWGAWCSITDPENEMTIEQWDIKKGYAENADRMSWDLLEKNLGKAEAGNQIEVVNTFFGDRDLDNPGYSAFELSADVSITAKPFFESKGFVAL